MTINEAASLHAVCGGVAFGAWRPLLDEAGLELPEEPSVLLGSAAEPVAAAAAVCRVSLRFVDVSVGPDGVLVAPDEQAPLRRIAAAHGLGGVPERFALLLPGPAPSAAPALPEVVVHATALEWRDATGAALHRVRIC